MHQYNEGLAADILKWSQRRIEEWGGNEALTLYDVRISGMQLRGLDCRFPLRMKGYPKGACDLANLNGWEYGGLLLKTLLAIGDTGDLISDRSMRRKVLTVLRLAISVWMLYHKREYAAQEVRNPPLVMIFRELMCYISC